MSDKTSKEPYYRDDLVTILHGDCLELLPWFSDGPDLIFTSPPYNLGTQARGSGGLSDYRRYRHAKPGKWGGGGLVDGYGKNTDDLPHEEYIAWQQLALAVCWESLSDSGALFYNHKPRVQEGLLQTPLELNPGLPLRQIIIWKRAGGLNYNPGYFVPMHEWVLLFAKPGFQLKSKGAAGIGDVWDVPQEKSDHPAPFPVGLPARAIEATAPRLVVDPFMGSGSTLVAAKAAGARAIGIEIEERWCEMAARRCSQEVLAVA